MKKFFLICLALLFAIHGAASAKQKGLPEEERIKVAVEVLDTSRHRDELNTAELLKLFLSNKLTEKNLLNVLGTEKFSAEKPDGLIRDEDVTAETSSVVENLGELLIFDAVELPPPVDTAKNFDQARYQNLGATYVVRCEVLALGLTKVDDRTYSMITSIIGSGFSISGSGNGNHDKTLRRIGTGISALGLIGMADFTKRTALNTVVNMQFIDVATGKVLWQANFTGQAVKHRRPGKNFDNVWERAFSESVEDSAKLISKRVNKYVDKVIIKGKSDKDFLPTKFSIGSFNTGKLF